MVSFVSLDVANVNASRRDAGGAEDDQEEEEEAPKEQTDAANIRRAEPKNARALGGDFGFVATRESRSNKLLLLDAEMLRRSRAARCGPRTKKFSRPIVEFVHCGRVRRRRLVSSLVQRTRNMAALTRLLAQGGCHSWAN